MKPAINALIKRIFLSLLLALGTLLSLGSCSQPKALVYQDIKGFKVQSIDLQQITVELDLLLYNPNRFSVDLKNGNLDAFINDRSLGKASIDERSTIPGHHSFIIPVTVHTTLSALFANALELLANKNKSVYVSLSGNIRAGRKGIFVIVPIHYEGQQKLNL